jgi:hypothetical protein
MKKVMKACGIILISVFLIILILFLIYVYKNYPRKIEPFEINKPELSNRILIASQGSEFKNALLTNLIGKIDNDSTYIKVINVSELNDVQDMDWKNIIIINTCIADKINKTANQFILQTNNTNTIIMLITAGDGGWKPINLSVDAISTASRVSYVEELTLKMVNQLQIQN